MDVALLEEARARFPTNHLLAWLAGRRLLAESRFEDAICVFAGAWSLDALGLCHFRLGHYAESVRCYARAEAAAPGDAQYHAKRRLAEARLGRAP